MSCTGCAAIGRRRRVAYRLAHELGRPPQPGYALLRLAEGQAEAASAAVRAALLARAGAPLARAPLCAAQVEIALAGDDLATARAAVDELRATAVAYASSGLAGAAALAGGAFLLTEGRADEALPLLLEACRIWRGCGARLRRRSRAVAARPGLPGRSVTRDSAALELDAADAAFAELGAIPGRAAVAALRFPGSQRPAGLTAREVEVLRCLAAGRTNREIAAALIISEKTVGRHLSNIFSKLGLTSRTAATAYAHEHGLMGRNTHGATTSDGPSVR